MKEILTDIYWADVPYFESRNVVYYENILRTIFIERMRFYTEYGSGTIKQYFIPKKFITKRLLIN